MRRGDGDRLIAEQAYESAATHRAGPSTKGTLVELYLYRTGGIQTEPCSSIAAGHQRQWVNEDDKGTAAQERQRQHSTPQREPIESHRTATQAWGATAAAAVMRSTASGLAGQGAAINEASFGQASFTACVVALAGGSSRHGAERPSERTAA